MNLVEEAARHWEMFREGTVADLDSVAEQDWDFRPEPGVYRAQDVGIGGARALALNVRLDARERLEQRLAARVDAVARCPGLEHGREAGFPVDQRAVAIEAQNREVAAS